TCLPSPFCRIVLAEGRAACAHPRDDLRGHGGCEWAGCRTCLWKVGIGSGRFSRTKRSKEGSSRSLRAGHAGVGQSAGKAQVRIPHVASKNRRSQRSITYPSETTLEAFAILPDTRRG